MTLSVNGKDVDLTLDTGAEITVLTRHSGKQLGLDLLPQTRLLKGAGGHDLKVVGEAEVCIRNKFRSVQATVSVLEEASKNLLRISEIKSLNLLAL